MFRFYFRCSACAAELTMKTDPANSDYAMERGGTRNYEPWRDKERTVTEAIAAREEEEKGNAMKARRALVAASAAGAARGRGREWPAPGTWLGVCQPGLPSAQAPVAARAAVTGAGRPKASSHPKSSIHPGPGGLACA